MSVLRRIDAWAFAPGERHQLGIFRVLFVAWFAYEYATRLFPRLARHAERSTELLAPVSVVGWFGLPAPVPPPWLPVVGLVAVLVLVASLLGVRTRVALVALAALNLWLGATVASFGYTPHASALPALVLVVLACAPGADACSVDAWLRSRRGAGRATEVLFGRPQSIWPVRLVLVLVCAFYFASGYAKVRYAGFRWADGRTLAFYLQGGSRLGPGEPQRFLESTDAPPAARFRDGWGIEDYAYVGRPTVLGRALGRSPAATRALSCFTLLVELGFPVVLFGRALLAIWLVLGVALHLGIDATLRIDFSAYLVVYLLFIDWKSLAQNAVVRRLQHR
jgi:uncharacterized membrane protein YphA (DoxX/SURF4 family)